MDEEEVTTTETETTTEETVDSPEEDLSVSGPGEARLIEIVSSLLPEGVELPPSVTGATLVRDLELMLAAISGMEGAVEEPAPAAEEVPSLELPAELSNQPRLAAIIRSLQKQVASQARQIKTLSNSGQASGRDRFMRQVFALANKGVPAAALNARTALARQYGWNLNLLADLQPTIPMGSVAKRLANGKAPSIGKGGKPTTETCKKAAKSFRR